MNHDFIDEFWYPFYFLCETCRSFYEMIRLREVWFFSYNEWRWCETKLRRPPGFVCVATRRRQGRAELMLVKRSRRVFFNNRSWNSERVCWAEVLQINPGVTPLTLQLWLRPLTSWPFKTSRRGQSTNWPTLPSRQNWRKVPNPPKMFTLSRLARDWWLESVLFFLAP